MPLLALVALHIQAKALTTMTQMMLTTILVIKRKAKHIAFSIPTTDYTILLTEYHFFPTLQTLIANQKTGEQILEANNHFANDFESTISSSPIIYDINKYDRYLPTYVISDTSANFNALIPPTCYCTLLFTRPSLLIYVNCRISTYFQSKY